MGQDQNGVHPPRGKSRSTIWWGWGRVQWTQHLGREPLLPFGAQRVWEEPGLLPGLGEGGCVLPSSPPTSVSPRRIDRKKKKKTTTTKLQIRRARAALDSSREEVGSWVGHIRPAAGLLGVPWVVGESGEGWSLRPGEEGTRGSGSYPG